MTKIAIDIVLLPPEKIIDLALKVNQKAVQQGNAAIELSKTNRIPHLSLLMGVLDLGDLQKVNELIEDIATQFSSMNLIIDTVDQECFATKKDEQLQRLHETLVKTIDPLLTHYAAKEMYLEEPDFKFVDNFDHWVNEFVNKYSFENFWPHITFHSPEQNPVSLPISFTTSQLAVCHLGGRNTCRKILFSTEMIK